MRDMLEPVFGETGAVAAQFVITLIVVLALIAIVYWLVRRFAGARFGSIARGRVPRLAIVDAMAIDNRRRLVLVRRDNAEHLILIGGPSDVLIEGPIRRVSARHRAEQQNAAARTASPPGEGPLGPDVAAAGEPAPTVASAESPELAAAPVQARPMPAIREAPRPAPPPPPPPLPVRRPEPGAAAAEATPPPSEPDVAEFRPRRTAAAIPAGADDHGSAAASAQFTEIAHATAVQPIKRPADHHPASWEIPERNADQSQAISTPAPPVPPDQPTPAAEGDERRAAPTAADGGDPATTPDDQLGDAEPNADNDTAAKVSDLEREMAKLLGEIGTKRAT